MHADKMKCWKCGWEGKIEMRYSCPVCSGSLDIGYHYERADREKLEEAFDHFSNMWDFQELLPVKKKEHIISLKEGGTPLHQAQGEYGCSVYWKDETRNPTLSFKDRPNTVGISVAKELGYKEVSIASTGNGGASLAAYAAKGKMKCHICIPEGTPEGKVIQALCHGAELTFCKGDYSDSYSMCVKRSMENGWANQTSTYLNPYTIEGDKTIAYEIFAQLGGTVPDWIAVPLGAGALLTGIYKGFWELKKLGFCGRLPGMIGVQTEGCAPIIDAWMKKRESVDAWGQCRTLAGAIADPLKGYEEDGTRTLHTIYTSGGAGVKVTDRHIMEALEKLAQEEGIFAEPASAAVAAAIEQMVMEDVIKRTDVALGIVTAHGLKDSGEVEKYRGGMRNEARR